ncbi:MAG: hypothetical protein ACLQGP_24565 [Isosphaeraceae bacterium]
MRPIVLLCLLYGAGTGAFAQESIKVEARKQAPPSSLAPDLLATLSGQSVRIQDGEGKEFAEIWLRQATSCSEKPSGPKGVIQFPFLADGEFLGILQFATEGHDYRDQSIAKGVYTMRYGLQPTNGDHLGVSAYRDYVLLLPASKDKGVAPPTRKQLEQRSAESAGTSHPASFLMLMAPKGAKPQPVTIHDSEKNTWSVVLPLQLKVKDQDEPVVYPIQLVVVGAAAV